MVKFLLTFDQNKLLNPWCIYHYARWAKITRKKIKKNSQFGYFHLPDKAFPHLKDTYLGKIWQFPEMTVHKKF